MIFLLAFGVRVLAWQDARLEGGRVQTLVSENYKHVARLLWQGGVAAFFSSSSPLADFNALGHPPGYSILLALIYGLRGVETDAGVQFFQIAADAMAVVVTFLIAAELLSRGVAVVAGLLAALSPQFAWNSVLLLPDTLAVLPVLLAVYCLVRAMKRPRLLTVFAAGALVGLSCWLRANALVLAPFLAVVVICTLFERGRKLRYTLALVGGMALVVAPLTIRNAVVFHSFIPLSLGAGQTLLEGIADYDHEGKFGIPSTDLAIIRGEAEASGRPDYAETLFGPDGLRRERARLSRGFTVIAAHPFWFSTVMMRRALSMLRLERARLVSPSPPVTHALEVADETQPVWSNSPAEMMRGGETLTASAAASLAPDGQTLTLAGDDAKDAPQYASSPIVLEKNTDYIFQAPLKIERGRMMLSVTGEDLRDPRVSTIIETAEGKTADEQPRETVRLPFVNLSAARVRLLFSNAAADPPRPVVQVEEVKLFALGEASSVWMRFPRFVVAHLQKLFVTALMLPLSILGCVLLCGRARERRTLIVLLAVPSYYFCVQSMLHTEYRYVLALHHFLFILAAVSLIRAGSILINVVRKIRTRERGDGSAPEYIASGQ